MVISIAPIATGARKPTYARTSVCRNAASLTVIIVITNTSTSISSWELLYLKPEAPPEYRMNVNRPKDNKAERISRPNCGQ
ncbi:hypothetical protein D3C86_1720310 [compost metagenome]